MLGMKKSTCHAIVTDKYSYMKRDIVITLHNLTSAKLYLEGYMVKFGASEYFTAALAIPLGILDTRVV